MAKMLEILRYIFLTGKKQFGRHCSIIMYTLKQASFKF